MPRSVAASISSSLMFRAAGAEPSLSVYEVASTIENAAT